MAGTIGVPEHHEERGLLPSATWTILATGPGFRKVRKGLGVTAFGANAIVMPPAYETGSHLHEEQEELYFVHSGRVEFEFGDGSVHAPRRGRASRASTPTPCASSATPATSMPSIP